MKYIFDKEISSDLKWMNEPAYHEIRDGQLVIKTTPNTDFWQRTAFGFANDNGNALLLKKKGDFIMETHVSFVPNLQYDQAGLLVYYNKDFWIKSPIEYDRDDITDIGAVVTNNGWSDWSIQSTQGKNAEKEFKIERKGLDFYVSSRPNDKSEWEVIRICHLQIPDDSEVSIGIFVASAKEGSCECKFKYLTIE